RGIVFARQTARWPSGRSDVCPHKTSGAPPPGPSFHIHRNSCAQSVTEIRRKTATPPLQDEKQIRFCPIRRKSSILAGAPTSREVVQPLRGVFRFAPIACRIAHNRSFEFALSRLRRGRHLRLFLFRPIPKRVFIQR